MNAIQRQPFEKRLWIYNGPGDGRGLVHLVVLDGAEEVVTWSLPEQAGDDGWSWQGDMKTFFQQFYPVHWDLKKKT